MCLSIKFSAVVMPLRKLRYFLLTRLHLQFLFSVSVLLHFVLPDVVTFCKAVYALSVFFFFFFLNMIKFVTSSISVILNFRYILLL